MLKADLHVHTSEDPKDGRIVKHSARELIDVAAEKGYEVISITNHNKVTYDEKLRNYAAKKGILLIPGIELSLKEGHVLVYNITQKQADKIKKIKDLKKIVAKKTLVVAPHMFYPIVGIGKKFLKHSHLFDAIEHCYFYTSLVNPNKKAMKIAEQYNKPVIGNSDLHKLKWLEHTYSFINS